MEFCLGLDEGIAVSLQRKSPMMTHRYLMLIWTTMFQEGRWVSVHKESSILGCLRLASRTLKPTQYLSHFFLCWFSVFVWWLGIEILAWKKMNPGSKSPVFKGFFFLIWMRLCFLQKSNGIALVRSHPSSVKNLNYSAYPDAALQRSRPGWQLQLSCIGDAFFLEHSDMTVKSTSSKEDS